LFVVFGSFTKCEPSTADFSDTICPDSVCLEIRKSPAGLDGTILFDSGPIVGLE
jgi:hypothetical protein